MEVRHVSGQEDEALVCLGAASPAGPVPVQVNRHLLHHTEHTTRDPSSQGHGCRS